MDRQGLTADALAKKTGVNRETLNGWLYKKRMPRADEATWLAGALETSVEYLVMGGDTPASTASRLTRRPPLFALFERLEPRSDEDLARVAIGLDAILGPARPAVASGTPTAEDLELARRGKDWGKELEKKDEKHRKSGA